MADLNLTQLLDLVKKMQKTQESLQQALSEVKATGQAGGGLVTVIMDGQYHVEKVQIQEAALNEESGILADLVIAATHDTVRQIDSEVQKRTLALTAELPRELGLPADLTAATANANLNEKAKKMQDNIMQTRDQLTNLEVSGQAGGELISVIMNGRHQIKKLVIEEEARQETVQILEELVSAALNHAVQKLQTTSQNKAYDILKDLGPLFNKELPDK